MTTAGSLYSGVGGLDLAVEALGFDIRWQVEVDPYRRGVLANHWPSVRRYEDIKALDPSELEPVDMVFGGFPCQPWSVAGNQRGEDDPRNLWPDTIRIIRGVRPRLAFLENVPGLLAHGYYGRILGDLAESGFDAEWTTLSARAIGASQGRARLWVLAHARHAERPGRLGDENGSERGTRGIAPSQSGSLAHARHEQQHIQQRLHGAEPAGEGGNVAHSDGGGRQERPQPHSLKATGLEAPRRGDADRQGRDVANTPSTGTRHQPGPPRRSLRSQDVRQGNREAGSVQPNPASQSVADTEGEQVGLSRLPRSHSGYHFPPSPDDTDGWARVLAEMPSLEPAVCRLADGVPDRVARLRALGDAVVWPQAYAAFRILMAQVPA